jgi:ubiquinone/menaquinone biosynthesis C-methylase UbiE
MGLDMADVPARYAFPHTAADERRRLDLFAGRLDPVTKRRIGLLGLAPDVRCLEIGGGRGSIARWLCQDVAPQGQVTATDLETGFLSELPLPNLTVLRHDVRTDDFPEGSFELVHVRAVLMHIPERMATLRRMVSWLAPGAWRLAGGRGARFWHVAG